MTSATHKQTAAQLLPFDIDGDGQIDIAEHELRTRVSQPAKRHVLQSRYHVLGQLGQGGQAKTYLALDARSCTHVVLKVLEIELASDWKSIELFEREAELLQQIDHPRIPAYIDHFRRVVGEKTQFVTVQQFVHGDDLSRLLERGVRWTPDEARARILELIEILEPLHRRTSPVIHRDIKPSNIILGADGHLHLVDFGAAQAIVPTTAGGSTIIGTTGFVPMEQYMGRAVPASDIYALGATVLQMVTGLHPADFELERSVPQFERYIADPGLRDLLAQMLEPHVEDRLGEVSQLRHQCAGHRSSALALRPRITPPSTSSASLAISKSNLAPLEHMPGVFDRSRPWLNVVPIGGRPTRWIHRLAVHVSPHQVRFSIDDLGVLRFTAIVLAPLVLGFVLAGPKGLLLGTLIGMVAGLAAIPLAMTGFAMDRRQTKFRGRLISTDSIERFEAVGSNVVMVTDRARRQIPLPRFSPAGAAYLAWLLNEAREQLLEQGRIDIEVW